MMKHWLFYGLSIKGKLAQGFGLLLFVAIFAVTMPPLYSVLNSHYESSSWVQVPATLASLTIDTEFAVAKATKGSTQSTPVYRLDGRYYYHYAGQQFSSTSISYYQGHDNIGQWHFNTKQRLQEASIEGRLTAWVNPKQPHQSYLVREIRVKYFVMGTALFTLFSSIALAFVVVPRLLAPRGVDPLGRVYPQRDSHLLMFVLMSVGSACIWIPLSGTAVDGFSNGNLGYLFFLFFPAFTLGFGIAAGVRFRQRRILGDVPVLLSPCPGQNRGDIGGQVLLPSPSPCRFWNITLLCAENRGSFGKESNKRQIWRGAQIVEADEDDLLTFVFQPTGDVPATDNDGSKGAVWYLTIEGQHSVRPCRREYVIPVEQGAEKTTFTTTAIQATSLSSANTQYVEVQSEKYYSLTRTGDKFVIESSGIRQWRDGGGLLLWAALIVVVGIGFSMIDDSVAKVAGMVALGISILTIGYAAVLLGRSLRAVVMQDQVVVERRWLGLRLWQRRSSFTSPSQVKSVAVTWGSGIDQEDHYFDVRLEVGGQTLPIVQRIKGANQSRYLVEVLRNMES